MNPIRYVHRSLMVAAAANLILLFDAPTTFAQLGIHATAESGVSGWRRMESGGNAVWVSPAPSLTSSDLETAYLNTGLDGRNRITLVFNEAGTEKMCEFSAANFGRPIAILLDGALLSMPTIRSTMGKEAAIDGPAIVFGPNALQRILATIDRKAQPPSERRCVPIRGRTTRQPNDAESSSVSLRPARGVFSSTTNVKSDGSFEFAMVPPGTYTLEPTWNGMRMPPPYSSITVTDKAFVGVELTIPKMETVLGRVKVEGDGPMPPLQFQISEGSWSASLLVFPKPDGSFSITLPEGQRRFGLLAILPPGYTLKSFTSGSTNFRGGAMLNVSEGDRSELQLTFETAPDSWFKVGGRVRGYDPSRMATVEMWGAPLSNFEMKLEPAPIRADGTFEFPKVLKGSYILRVRTPDGDLSAAITVSDNVPDVELRR